MTQVIELLLSKCRALSSDPSTAKNKKDNKTWSVLKSLKLVRGESLWTSNRW
jgi:hypothetical protein